MERNYEQEIKDIEVHMDMLCDTVMRNDACVDKDAHTLPFQIFRILGGYNDALERLKRLDWFERAQFVIGYNKDNGEFEAVAKNSQKTGYGETAEKALSNLISQIVEEA